MLLGRRTKEEGQQKQEIRGFVAVAAAAVVDDKLYG